MVRSPSPNLFIKPDSSILFTSSCDVIRTWLEIGEGCSAVPLLINIWCPTGAPAEVGALHFSAICARVWAAKYHQENLLYQLFKANHQQNAVKEALLINSKVSFTKWCRWTTKGVLSHFLAFLKDTFKGIIYSFCIITSFAYLECEIHLAV